MKPRLVLSCEHGGNAVPARYRDAFRSAGPALAAHTGWDPGSLELARGLARRFQVPLVAHTTTRLLADPNRSRDHPRVLSRWSRALPPEEREAVLDRHWAPHRAAVEAMARARARRGGPVLHLSVHSFTPVFEGRVRGVDVGLLYDPSRARERRFVDGWIAALGEARPDLRLRRNQPYRGWSDGLTTHLRQVLGARRYLGIELEVSQAVVLGPPAAWRRLRRGIGDSLESALARGFA